MGQLLGTGLAFCEGLLQSVVESRSPKLAFVCQHFSFCPRNISSRVWSGPSTAFQSSFSHYPVIVNPTGPVFSAIFQSFCVPPWRASFPSLSKVEFPDGNRNYKHMLLLSATIGLANFSFKGNK